MQGGITTQILDFISNLIPYLFTNSSQLFEVLIRLAQLLAVFFWFYCGYYIFVDSQKRYTFESRFVFYAFLLMGLVTGPIGLIFYILTRPRNTFDELEFMKVEHKFYYHQASKVLDCIKCGAYVLEGHSHCTNCGTENRFKCEKCSALTDYDDMYCNNCGFHFEKRFEQIYDSILSKEEKNVVKKESKPKSSVKYDITGKFDGLRSQVFSVYSNVKSKAKDISSKAKVKAKEVATNVKDTAKKVRSSGK